jgi:DNA-binding beta-propeller fold protein YncE
LRLFAKCAWNWERGEVITVTRKKVRRKIRGYITWLALVVAAALAVGLVSMVTLWPQDAKAAEAPPAFITKWGNSTDGDGEFSNPQGVATDSSGNVYVADTWNHRIQKFDPSGGFITKWGNPGSGDGQFISPLGVAIDHSGNVYVADSGNNRIQKFGNTTTTTSEAGRS